MKIEYFASPEIKALAKHSAELGWYSEVDWECFLRTGVVFGHRLKTGEIVSSAYLSNFENQVGWMGAVIVNPRFQGKKLGRDLIQKALSIAPADEFVLGLIATERGKRMYEQAGFVEVGNTCKLTGEIASSASANFLGVRDLTEGDLEIISVLDVEAIGYRRTKPFNERLKSASEACVFENDRSEIRGFIFANKDGERISLGPLVAPNVEIALQLLKTATAGGGSYRLDIPHWQSDFIKAVESLGFKLERICPLLTFKGRALPRASDNYFAIMGQAFG
jgi:GNAT superfamily N-acetyltransferase